MDASNILETGVAALLLAVAFLVGDRTRILGWLLTPPSITSFGGGMAAAYVFLHVTPELNGARLAFANTAAMTLPYEGMGIYYLALAGFLTFYGLKHFHTCPLSHEYGTGYRRTGRFVLAGMALTGWASPLVLDAAPGLLPLLLAFLSGAVIMNSLILELPTEKEGRFWPFMTVGLLYGLILLPLG